MRKILFFATAAFVALSSCKKDNDKKGPETVFKGESKTFQHGKAWTWYEIDANNNPKRIAIAIDDAAMNSLETKADEQAGHHHTNMLSMQLHPKAGATPFTHVLLDWNPEGHEPEHVYDKPHFDFHFYTSTEAERMAIPVYEQATAKFDNLPFAYMPADFVPTPGGVPQMGKHWVWKFAPELAGNDSFTETFLFGSYDGKVTFYEPMITEAFIKANPAFQRDIPVPAKYQAAGWYPTKMRIVKEGGATNIILENFVQRTAN